MRDRLPGRLVRAVQRGRHVLDRAVAAAGERSARRLHPWFPYSIRLDYPPSAALEPRYGYRRPVHPGLEALLQVGAERYRAHLEAFAAWTDELAAIPLRGMESSEPCWIHNWLIGLDTVSLYGFVRARRPARFVEVGSGQSTKVVARARSDGDVAMEITSLDPRPRSEVDGLCDRLIRRPLETADLEDCFGAVRAGDVVFFDGSHRVLPNSDCVAFFLDVLPSLPAGVLVGVHDIFLPHDYPEEFVGFYWSEQYLLAAVLLNAPTRLRVELPTNWASFRPDLAAPLDPLFGRPEMAEVDRRGSLFWLETTGDRPAPA